MLSRYLLSLVAVVALSVSPLACQAGGGKNTRDHTIVFHNNTEISAHVSAVHDDGQNKICPSSPHESCSGNLKLSGLHSLRVYYKDSNNRYVRACDVDVDDASKIDITLSDIFQCSVFY